eukprot:1158101-Pelagomonas_calceolata.AAC.2
MGVAVRNKEARFPAARLLDPQCGGREGLSLASLLHAAARWMGGGGVAMPGAASGLAFSGWLPPAEVVRLLVLQLARGPDFLVYAAAAVSLCLCR